MSHPSSRGANVSRFPSSSPDRRRRFPAASMPSHDRLAVRRGSPVGLPQRPDEHRPKRPILLAVDQELCEGATLGTAPELADSDPPGPVEVG
jgi:hypothetical protein